MAEKKPRRRKSLKVELENKVEEPLTESTQVEEVKEEKQTELPKLDPNAKYTFVSNGTFRTMPKGSIWTITGEVATIFLSRGYGNLKK